jgi:protein SCO1/2
MNPSSKRFEWIIWGALVATIGGVMIAFVASRFGERTPDLPLISELPEFTLTNQFGQPFTKASLVGHVTLADIIFSRCAGPCPEMTRKMSSLQRLLPDARKVKLLTLTTDPGYDTPSILKEYGSRFHADFDRWSFVTGGKFDIARLAVNGLKLVAQEKPVEDRSTAEDLFIHSTIFVIVDKHARLRGPFDSTDADFEKQVRAAVKKLLSET